MEKKIKVSFVLPGRGIHPVGGFRIVYEYANRLTELGVNVTILHTACLYKSHSFFIGILRYVYYLFFFKSKKKWFELNPKINNKWIFTAKSIFIPNSDIIIATSWETAEHVAELSDKKGLKVYFIQGNESEFVFAKKNRFEERVFNTWNLPMKKIVIGSWLQEKLFESGNVSELIFNGLNFNDFYIDKNIYDRDPFTIMMLYHDSPSKGCDEGLEAIKRLKVEKPLLKVVLFGVPDRPENLESWIEYYKMPDRNQLRELYNNSAVFLSPSHSEGWGLPVAEAMQCGCVVLTSNIGGFKDFVKNKETGLCFEVQNVDDLIRKLNYLLENDEFRVSLALAGNLYVRKFDWTVSTMKMFNFLSGLK